MADSRHITTNENLRQRAAYEIERLIDLLDAIDADSEDLEPSHGLEMVAGELDDAEADEADREPELGSSNPTIGGTQALWAVGENGELDTADDEPSLCGVGSHVQQSMGNDQDLEDNIEDHRQRDDSETGIGDADGLWEQMSRKVCNPRLTVL